MRQTKIDKDELLEFIKDNDGCKNAEIMYELYDDDLSYYKPLDNALQSLRRNELIFYDNGWFATDEAYEQEYDDDDEDDEDDCEYCVDEDCVDEWDEFETQPEVKLSKSTVMLAVMFPLEEIKKHMLDGQSEHKTYKEIENLVKTLEILIN